VVVVVDLEKTSQQIATAALAEAEAVLGGTALTHGLMLLAQLILVAVVVVLLHIQATKLELLEVLVS
jgi:hypothetical protein